MKDIRYMTDVRDMLQKEEFVILFDITKYKIK